MGKFCCVPGCNNRANRDKFDAKGQTIGYFQFPPDNDPRRHTWIRNIRRDPGPYFSISGTTCVCSMHFEEEYIERLAISTGFRLRLTKEAIPTIFSWNGESNGNNSSNNNHGGNNDTAYPEEGDSADEEDTTTNGDYDGQKGENGEDGGGSADGDASNANNSGSSKRKLHKPQNRPAKSARRATSPTSRASLKKYSARNHLHTEFTTKEESDAEIVRLRSTVQVFERKFAEMSRLVNELRSTTIKMLGVMSAGTNQQQ